jgi:D-beta-D-heptose 7-phosphate kinase/D-beta-D-heptose 1-phosphate adenosyltransferase
MRENAIEWVRAFRGQQVLLIGDALLDTYVEGEAARLCREGPIPLFHKLKEEHLPGGAANVAANLNALGADVVFVSVLGQDHAGGWLREALQAHGVSDRWLLEDDTYGTPHKMRLLAEGQYIVRLDEGVRQASSTPEMSESTARHLLEVIDQQYPQCQAVMISDYHYGVLSAEVIARLAHLQQMSSKPLVIDSQALERFADVHATVVTPNLAEAQRLVARLGAGTTSPSWEQLAQSIGAALSTEHVAITLASQGVFLLDERGHGQHLPTHAVEHAADVGAGDAFAAAMTLALSVGVPMPEAVQIGMDAAGISIRKPRTAVVFHQELLQRVSVRIYSQHREQAGHDALAQRIASVRIAQAQGKCIVCTNGVFDQMHAGHVHFLRQAKALGDVLIVGVNSDRSARHLKGAGRPVSSEQDRLALVAALDPVDDAFLFEDETFDALLCLFKPDLYVKGGDYTPETIPEAATIQEIGCGVVILPLVGGATASNQEREREVFP